MGEIIMKIQMSQLNEIIELDMDIAENKARFNSIFQLVPSEKLDDLKVVLSKEVKEEDQELWTIYCSYESNMISFSFKMNTQEKFLKTCESSDGVITFDLNESVILRPIKKRQCANIEAFQKSVA